MVGSSENILVEFDYNNITIIDPNKVIDSDGKVKERNVKMEDLVMYANLECKLVPRTKLIYGISNNNDVQNISIANINFLNQGGKTLLDNSYTDELTGKGVLQGLGVNQVKQDKISTSDKPDDYFIKQTLMSNGKVGAVDNGLLGITSININQGMDFLPSISVTLEDIKGRAMFEAGDNSPYAAFFNLPYPMFTLTIKGYYGKAVKLSLMLQTFTSRYDNVNGNFKIDLKFYTYKYTMLSEVTMAALLATPHMYQSRLKISTKTTTGAVNPTEPTKDVVVERGFQKIKEVYSEYKSKGLIPDDFPEITLVQLRNNIENFIKNILDSFTKQNLDPLSYIEEYQESLRKYGGEVFLYGGTDSWFGEYMDQENFFIKKDGSKLYTFKTEFQTGQKNTDAISKLNGIIKKYNELLKNDKTLGENGSYTIDGKVISSKVSFDIAYGTFTKDIREVDINLLETYLLRTKTKSVTEDSVEFKAFVLKLQTDNYLNNIRIRDAMGNKQTGFQWFAFEGKDNFEGVLNKISKVAGDFTEQIQNELTKALSTLLQSKANGIGFVPTIRNVLAVVFASGEGFLRLMDDVHTQAWELRNNDTRKNVIFDTTIANASQDNLTSGDVKNQPVFPWPQMIVGTSGEDGSEKYTITYPGDKEVINKTKAYLSHIWPEVEFLEEFVRGYTERDSDPTPSTPKNNELNDIQRVSFTPIEFPVDNSVYGNKEEVKFFYEIFERMFMTSNYSGLIRSSEDTTDTDVITSIIAEGENINLTKSLSDENPFLIKKLKEFNLSSGNFEVLLRHISNDGTGNSWQNFIRGIFNTSYIKNKVNNSSFTFIDKNVFTNSNVTQPLISLASEDKMVNFISEKTTTNSYNFTDLYPFTDLQWDKSNLSNGSSIGSVEQTFNTTNVLVYNTNVKTISNFKQITDTDVKRPITNFLFKDVKTPQYTEDIYNGVVNNINNLNSFYSSRYYNTQLPTEGNLRYFNYSGGVSANQTVSILNTPYFINSIQQGVNNYLLDVEYPYKSAAYLFINSLPLATLREKYKTYENESSNDLDYIFATLKKFGAIHKLPYAWVLKIGSIWHRYKTYVNTNVDIIDTSWSGFSYTKNFSPIANSPETNYSLNFNNGFYDIVLEKNTTLGTEVSTVINTGFYPKLINDFNIFYQGFEVYTGYTNSDIQNGFNSGVTLNYVPSAIIDSKEGFDSKNKGRDLRIVPWSVFVNTRDGISSFIMPSQGSLINQTKNECFTNEGKLEFEVTGNTAMYNGSVRLFWSAPNYGYFDVNKVVKPLPHQYMKNVSPTSYSVFGFSVSTQENYSINGQSSGYTSMNEIFSVFEKDILDKFETEFLDFSKSIYDYQSTDISNTDSNSEKSFKNFQMLMRDLMKVPKSKGIDGKEIITDMQKQQITSLSNGLNQFLNYDVVFKYGNPANFDKRLFYSFSSPKITNPYTWDKYSITTPNTLPTSGGSVTLLQSKTNSPDVWKTLETYVGFSDVSGLTYSNNGSCITDFFVDCNVAFNTENIINLAPIIKIYATQKLKDKTLNYSKFIKLMDNYILSVKNFQDKTFNNLMIRLRQSLPDVGNASKPNFETVLEGTQTKVELWESFKAINDKWISGGDFKTKTLFEDVLLLDRASRNVGNEILIDVYKLKDLLTNIPEKVSMLSFVQTILVENNFVVMNLPSYVNFYGVQDAVKNPIPKAEGTLDFANTMFGAFMNVDYRESSAKLVCFYASKPSEHVEMKNNVDYRFKNDAFDLRKNDNPLVENQMGKNDWDKSNKVVGFNVDIGPQNQSIFYGFQVDQNPGLATAESLEVLNQMANLYGNRGGASQNVSLYNLYKNRSYTCTVSMMGNAMIQPTMYFNLRHVPMFSGPYLIQKVTHAINPGSFETIITGIRQPTASLPKINDYIQSLKTNLLKTIIDKNKQDRKNKEESIKSNSKGDVIKQKADTYNDAMNKGGNTSASVANCYPANTGGTQNIGYSEYVVVTAPKSTKESFKTIADLISSKTSDKKLRYIIFTTLHLASGTLQQFESNENNFAGIKLNEYWGDGSNSYLKGNQYYCSAGNQPFALFNTPTDNINFLISRWSKRVGNIKSITKEELTKFWIINEDATQKLPNVYSTMDKTQLTNIENEVQKAIDVAYTFFR
jgi:hypothetical protein